MAMDKQNKKKLAVALVSLVAIVVLFIGIAYAAVGSYTGQAVNSGNTTSDVTSVKLTIGENSSADYTVGKFSNCIYFNTNTNGSGTQYTLTDGQAQTVGGVDNLVKLGELVLHTEISDNNDTYTIKVSDNGSGANIVSGDYYIQFDSEVPVAYSEGSSGSGYTTGNYTGNQNITVSLYIKASDLASLPNGWVLNNVTFTFLATATPVAGP